MQKPQPISGFPEHLPGERMAEQSMLDQIRSCFELFGFSPIETPAVERMDSLTVKGAVDKQIYRLFRPEISDGDARSWAETEFGLHFDLTIPLARYVAQNYGQLVFPFRRYQIQKVWRGERPKRGRFREFYQCDIDIVGENELSLLADAEVVAVLHDVFKELNLTQAVVHVSNRKLLEGMLFGAGVEENQISGTMAAIDDLQQLGRDFVAKRMVDNGLAASTIEKVLGAVEMDVTPSELQKRLSAFANNETLSQGIAQVREITGYLALLGVPENAYKIDLSIARGLDYYTGTVYETFLTDSPEYGSICSGGRYDDLAGRFINKKLPGVGISLGFTRLFDYLKNAGALAANHSSPAKALVTSQDSDAFEKYLLIAAKLRSNGIPTEMYGEKAKLSAQMNYARKKGIPFTIIANREEAETGTFILHDMGTGGEQKLSAEEIVEALREKC